MHDEDRDAHQQPIHVLMAGGGTGGHVYPALAIASELAKRGHSVSWVGRPASMEEAMVSAAGVDFHALGARPWVGKGAAAKLGAGATLATSTLRARSLVRRLRVDCVLGTGGYVSVPAVLGARLARRPAFLLEPNAVAGAANRFASRWCQAAFVARAETGGLLRCEAVVSGIPVRESFHEIGALQPGEPQLLILGGSQGALQINELMPRVVRRLRAQACVRFRVLHQTGRAHIESVERAYSELGLEPSPDLKVTAFIEDMAAAMAAAHLVISRAGALTTAELAAAGRPSILIPLLGAGAGHQRSNAERMERAGAAVALVDEEVTADGLSDAIVRLIEDPPRLKTMAAAARSQATPDAASRIATILQQAGGAG